MSEPLLRIEDLHAAVEGTEILRGLDLVVPRGQVHAIMGPNGSGKSTLASVLMGHPAYDVTSGRILFKGEDVTGLEADERARLGMFLAFQYPVEVPGVSVMSFLRSALKAAPGGDASVWELQSRMEENMEILGMDPSFSSRSLNEGFSGGEKKRNEVLQLMTLAPELAILDETDSGLDIDGVRLVSKAVDSMRSAERGFLVITHYMRILGHLQPDAVHVLMDGRIVRSGGRELAEELEEDGYDSIRRSFAAAGP